MPAKCPVCGSPVVAAEDQAVYKCTGGCSSAARSAPSGSCISPAAARWTSRGSARSSSSSWSNDGTVSTPADLYDLTARRRSRSANAWARSPRRTSSTRSTKSKQTTLPRFLFALGIPQVGESTALALAQQFGTLEKLAGGSAAQIEETPDVGPDRLALGVRSSSRAISRQAVRRPPEARGVTYEPIKVDERAERCRSPDLTFVITGTLAGLQRERPKTRCAHSARRCRAACRRRPASSWWARMRARSSRRRSRSACASWMRRRSSGSWRRRSRRNPPEVRRPTLVRPVSFRPGAGAGAAARARRGGGRPGSGGSIFAAFSISSEYALNFFASTIC